MLFLTRPSVLLDFENLFPSKTLTFDENMNAIARIILISHALLAIQTEDYERYLTQACVALILFSFIVYVANTSAEGLSATSITKSTNVVTAPVVNSSPSFETKNKRGRGFFKDVRSFQTPRPQPSKKKIGGLYMDANGEL